MEIKNQSVRAVTVYASSSSQIAPVYFEAARTLGKLFAEKKIICINGGGNKGLMGAVSDAVLEYGGEVVGIIPQFMLEQGWGHERLTEQIITSGMHERKQLLAEKADACIALPGGIGTLDELMEIITWKQLGLYVKPIAILNTNDYYSNLLEMLARAQHEKFMHEKHTSMWTVAHTPEEAIRKIKKNRVWEEHPLEFAAL
ncbi:MAG: TIGR00730 family Rossman fold protein [Dysgonamonadaceae bacterium]|nr:TIGR00730 family Rossman fold protein [Dysgonamonadaceae bacterium]